MPGQGGLDQQSQEYDPCAYIGEDYVGHDVTEVIVGKWSYRAGKSGGRVVAERRSKHAGDRGAYGVVCPSRIPKKVSDAVEASE